MDQKLIDCFPTMNRQVVSIVGSGGKTSLMWYLAMNGKQEKVLITTSTKIGRPLDQKDHCLVVDDFSQLGKSSERIEVAGIPVCHGRKLAMPPEEALRESLVRFDSVLIEADGSKQLPLKAWADFEPVILPETTITIGVLPLSVLGKTINEQTIHRLDRFLTQFPFEIGQSITPSVLVAIIEDKLGLFAKAKGEKILFLNQCDQIDEVEIEEVGHSLLSLSFVNDLERIIIGSVSERRGRVLWER